MSTPVRWPWLPAAALAAAGLIACGRGTAGGRGDTASARLAAPARQAPPAESSGARPSSASVQPTSAPIPADVEGVCAAVAAFWRRDSADVRRVDSVVTPYLSDTALSACVVAAYEEHSRLRKAGPADPAAERLETALALVRGAGRGWAALVRYGADGPDGSTLAYQRGRVRCLVEQSWDGGDDSDTTYVPADWFKEQTTCWAMAGNVAASDTSP